MNGGEKAAGVAIAVIVGAWLLNYVTVLVVSEPVLYCHIDKIMPALILENWRIAMFFFVLVGLGVTMFSGSMMAVLKVVVIALVLYTVPQWFKSAMYMDGWKCKAELSLPNKGKS